jgi:hypothetical protein
MSWFHRLLSLMSSSPILNTAVEASLVLEQGLLVIPAQVGIQIAVLDSRLRGNNGTRKSSPDDAPACSDSDSADRLLEKIPSKITLRAQTGAPFSPCLFLSELYPV